MDDAHAGRMVAVVHVKNTLELVKKEMSPVVLLLWLRAFICETGQPDCKRGSIANMGDLIQDKS